MDAWGREELQPWLDLPNDWIGNDCLTDFPIGAICGGLAKTALARRQRDLWH
jgi:hypothetical protein